MSPTAGARAATRLTEARRTLPPGAIELACHAALPVVIDPPFLNLLRINFFVDPPDDLPWTVEADLLASPLFRELGGELFEIDEDLRRSLLVSLRTRYGSERVEQVALLLERYCDQPGVWGGQPYLAQAQRLTVAGILDPAGAVSWLDDLQADGTSSVELSSDWIVAMRGRLTAQPAPGTTLNDEIAEAAERLRAGDPSARADLTTLELLPGSDIEAVRAAREVGVATSPKQLHFGHNFPRLDISWGTEGGDHELSGTVLRTSGIDDSGIVLRASFNNDGDGVYVSVIGIDPALQIALVHKSSPGDPDVPRESLNTFYWHFSFEAARDKLSRHAHLLDREGLLPFRNIAVVSDAPIDLGWLDGQFILVPESSSEADWNLVLDELKALMISYGTWSGNIRVALIGVDYSVIFSPTEENAGAEDARLRSLQQTVDRQRLQVSNDRDFRKLARDLDALADALAANGRYGEAANAAGETVGVQRGLSEREPGNLSPLATALTELSEYLTAAGRYSEALAASREAVDLRRRLQQDGDDDLGSLARALNTQAHVLAAVSRYAEALAASEEAVHLYRLLRSSGPDLAVVLNVRSELLASAGRREQALSDSVEATSIYRELAERDRWEHLPGLAATLTKLSRNLESVGRLREALEAGGEAIALHRELTRRNRDLYAPGLASALSEWSHLLAVVGRRDEALAFSEEAVEEQRRIVDVKGEVHLPGLAAALSNLSRLLADANRMEESLAACVEAVALFEEIDSLSGLTGELKHLEALYAALGRSSEAAAVRSRRDVLAAGREESRPVVTATARHADFDTSRDAVVFVPGIGGSELVDAASGRVLWGSGTGNAVRFVRGTTERLLVTDEDRAGDISRITAGRLIRSGVVLPGVVDLDPYFTFLGEMRSSVAHPDALLNFAYDWRLSVAHNAKRLSASAEFHLARWRAHPSGGPDAKLTVVAHSLGGLVALNYLTTFGGAPYVRRFLAIGTPFHGTVTAVTSVARHGGSRVLGLRQLYQSMPAMYDILPAYRCVDTAGDLRRLTIEDVVSVGGSGELAAEAFRRRLDLEESSALLAAAGTQVTTVVGIGQPTPKSFRIDGGRVTTYEGRGDGVVYEEAATLPGSAPPALVARRAGSLTTSAEVGAFIRAFLTRTPARPRGERREA
ncbi:tetratricopeptide repeat protein [Actinoplanes sp. NPDC048988]|uniref:tetratricopeptide repeat protein n=1 Tax=Actinoplanes sp. NPDC048988 TaxID=3363901 RepID=UPI0037199A05